MRSFFAAGNPTLGFRLMLFMLQSHLRRAALGEEYDPEVVEFVEARVGAQPTIEAAFRRDMEWLRWERNLPGVMLFTPASQEFLAGRPNSLAFNAYILSLEYGRPHVVLDRGDLGFLSFTKDPLNSPHMLRRTPAGWQIDLVAEVRNTQELAAGLYSWRYRGRGDDFSTVFADQLLQVSPEIVRLRHGDNRPLRALRPWFK
jgi:hypothetical protein